MSSVGKRIALGIAGGLQGAVEGVSTAQKLQTSAEQAKAQLAFSQANLEQVAAEREKMANQIQDQSMKTFDNVMKDIALLPDDASRKAAATIQFPILNKLAPKAGYQPFTDPDEIVNHFKIGELRQSEIDWSDSVKNIPQAINGKLTPEQAADAFRKAENALTIQSKYYLANPNDIDAIKRKSAQLEQAKTVYYQKSQKLAEANAPAAQTPGGQTLTKSQVEDAVKLGNTAYQGVDPKTGKIIVGTKPRETSREERLTSQFLTNQTNKLSGDLNKNKVPQLEKSLIEIDKQLAALPRNKDGAFDIPGYGAGTSALPQWLLSSDGKKMRQYIQNATDQLLRQRSGAQINETELKRLNEIAGTGKFQTEQTVLDGLQLIKDSVSSVKDTIAGGYGPDVIQNYLNNQKNRPEGFNLIKPNEPARAAQQQQPVVTKHGFDLSGL